MLWIANARPGEGALIMALIAFDGITGTLETYIDALGRKSLALPNRRRLDLEPAPGAVMEIAAASPGTIDISADVITCDRGAWREGIEPADRVRWISRLKLRKVAELSKLPEIEYIKARREVASTHEVPAGFLDREVAKRRPKPSRADYLSASKMPAAWVEGVVTNPPYRYAQRFAERALYVALLLRTNFLMDAEDRGCWLDRNEPTRADYLLLRLPMMHREGWTGKRSSCNTPSPGSSGRRPPRANFRSVYWKELRCIKKPVTSASGMRFRARRDSISFRQAERRAQGRSP